METKENNQEELLDKKELLSDEELQDVAAGDRVAPLRPCSSYFRGCPEWDNRRESCVQKCAGKYEPA